MTRVVFFGTDDLGRGVLEKLVSSGFSPVLVVTTPDGPAKRGGLPAPCAVKAFARERGLEVFSPKKLDEEAADNVRKAEPEVFVVAGYGRILPSTLLDIPGKGALNVHTSLLPKYRGPSPEQGQILGGEKTAGSTVILMDEKTDHGPILAQKTAEDMDVETVYYPELRAALIALGADLLAATLPRWLEGGIRPEPQEHEEATFTERFARRDGRIDWTESAKDIERRVRALNPWPGTFTFMGNKRLKIHRAAAEKEIVGIAAGTVSEGFVVAAGEGSLRVRELQLEGKKRMSAEEFLRGYGEVIGTKLE